MYRFCLFLTLLLAQTHAQASVDQHFQALQHNPHALYAFLKEMPKGGELHYHYDGAVYTETMLHLAIKSKLCIHPLSLSSQFCQPKSHAFRIDDVVNQPSMISKVVHSWSMQQFVPHHESAHDHFFSVFPKVATLYATLKGQLLAVILKKAAAQHEVYMEIIAFGLAEDDEYVKLIHNEKGLAKKRAILLANPEFQHSVDEIIKESEAFLPSAHSKLHCDKHPEQAACQIQIRFQCYVRRVKSLDSVFAQTLAGFMAAERSQQIVGINLLDVEDNPIAQRDYAQQMQIFGFLHEQYPHVSIDLHAGELFPKSVTTHTVRSPIRDAIEVGHAQRIGHGLDILDEPEPDKLAQMMAQKAIAVEVNLTSNHLIFGVHGAQHPLGFYLKHQVPVVLSTDDEGILRTDLTHEYLSAAQQHHLDYASLKHINRNALTYAFMPGTSIWKDPVQAIPVLDCKDLKSAKCQKFIQNNMKASLQWRLEQDLEKFEKRWE